MAFSSGLPHGQQVFCEGCKRYWTTRNRAAAQHIPACLRRAAAGAEAEAFLNAAMDAQEVIDSLVDPDQSAETFDMSIYDPGLDLNDLSADMSPMSIAHELPNTGYIKLVYHPHSKRSPRIIDLAVPVALPTCSTRTTSPEDPPPWNPFPSYADFDFAEAVTIDGLSNVSIDKYLSKINGTWSETSKLNIKNSADVKSYLTEAAAPYAQFSPHKFTVPLYKKDGTHQDHQFTVWVKDVMAWIRELLRDPALRDDWEWYPYQKFVFEDGKEIRCYDEPLSGEDAWEAQDRLQPDQFILELIAWSDKTNVARFTDHTVWPFIIRIANLPKELRNRNGSYSGNTLIALLPKVDIIEAEKSHAAWPLFVREVYHRAMDIILEHFEVAAKFGFSMQCSDEVLRHIFIRFAILTQDLEEAWITALNRGINANYPCPRCLVKNKEQNNLSNTYKLRTTTQSQQVFVDAVRLNQTPGKKTEAEMLLQNNGLYGIRNAWWKLPNFDVYQALSFDILHTLWLGLLGYHLWNLVLNLLKELDVSLLSQLDERVQEISPFPGFPLPNRISNVLFADGRRYFTIMRIILPILLNMIPKRFLPLLHVIRCVLCICLHTSMKLQTTTRIQKGEELLQNLHKNLQTLRVVLRKDFDFPKYHQLYHLFDDVRRKGNPSNMTTVLGEGFLQGVKKAYEISNKKNTLEQILRTDNFITAVSRIRWQVDERKWQKNEVEDRGMSADCASDAEQVGSDTESEAHLPAVKLGSPLKVVSINQLEKQGEHFLGFGSQLRQFLSDSKEDHNEAQIGNNVPMEEVMIREYRIIYHNYVSKDDYTLQQDIIRCYHSFFNQERRDTVLVDTDQGRRAASLQMIFECEHQHRTWQLAQLLYYAPVGIGRDPDIGQQCIRRMIVPQIVELASIERACHLIPAFDEARRDHYINDLVDTDMYLRLCDM